MTSNLAFALGLFALAASCGGDMMSDHLGRYDQQLGYAQTEVTAHATAATGAATSSLSAAEDGHLTRMLGRAGDMRGDVRQMMSCGSTDGATMMGVMDDFERECRTHRAAIAAAPDETTVRGEEARHLDAMNGMMGRMRSHSRSMMSASGAMGCMH